MKLVPMAGLDINYYKGHVIEWIEDRGAYRVYEEKHPEQTCFYADNIREAYEIIDENV